MIKIMIVDDEKWTRDIIKTFGKWEEYGMQIVGEAENGLDAIRISEQSLPQLVITDMRMPRMDGIELLNYFKLNYPEIKLIVVSGHDDFMYTKQAIQCKVHDYLLKPIDAKELNAALLRCKADLEETLHDHNQLMTLHIDVLDIINTYKPVLSAHYNDLNLAGIDQTFNELLHKLKDSELMGDHEVERIYQEFILLLKDLELRNSLEASEISSTYEWCVHSSPMKTIEQLSDIYLTSVDRLMKQRKYKNRLNLDEIKQFIDHYYSEPITLEKIARSFFVSSVYLSRAFKSEFEQNISDYIQNLRMKKAKIWLENDQIPIKAIAEMCGYEEIAYFYRVFKKHYGITPGEMRKK